MGISSGCKRIRHPNRRGDEAHPSTRSAIEAPWLVSDLLVKSEVVNIVAVRIASKAIDSLEIFMNSSVALNG